MSRQRIFLLSPAHCGGERAKLLFRPQAKFELAMQLRTPQGAPIGEVFRFLSAEQKHGARGGCLHFLPDTLVQSFGCASVSASR